MSEDIKKILNRFKEMDNNMSGFAAQLNNPTNLRAELDRASDIVNGKTSILYSDEKSRKLQQKLDQPYGFVKYLKESTIVTIK